MNCFRPKNPKPYSRTKQTPPQGPSKRAPNPANMRQEVLLTIRNCKVHLLEEGEAIELARGDFEIVRISHESAVLGTFIRVGDDLQWPLTKDEPTIKLGPVHYLFSLPLNDGEALSYGVTFSGGGGLGSLDSFLRENSCFSVSAKSTQTKNLDWEDFAPAVEGYNNFLARAIAGGTGQIVKGIFKCSNAYSNQVQKGGETILTQAAEHKKSSSRRSGGGTEKKSQISNNLKRVRKVSKMTEKMSKMMLDRVGSVGASVMGPVVRSQAGKSFFAMAPGEILLASIDAVNKVLEAAEAAEKQTFSATSTATSRMVSQRFGESAGEATEDALAAAGHCACAAWNVTKTRKALYPPNSVSSGVLKSATKNIKS